MYITAAVFVRSAFVIHICDQSFCVQSAVACLGARACAGCGDVHGLTCCLGISPAHQGFNTEGCCAPLHMRVRCIFCSCIRGCVACEARHSGAAEKQPFADVFFRNKARVLQTRCTACLACVRATLQLVAVCESDCHGQRGGWWTRHERLLLCGRGCRMAVVVRAQARPTHACMEVAYGLPV